MPYRRKRGRRRDPSPLQKIVEKFSSLGKELDVQVHEAREDLIILMPKDPLQDILY